MAGLDPGSIKAGSRKLRSLQSEARALDSSPDPTSESLFDKQVMSALHVPPLLPVVSVGQANARSKGCGRVQIRSESEDIDQERKAMLLSGVIISLDQES